MSGSDNFQINAAYVASWKQENPKLFDMHTDGHYLYYKNQKLDISDIYMQDLLNNPTLFRNLSSIEGQDLFNVISIHVNAIKIKEKELQNKVRRLNEYEYSNGQ